LSVRISEVITLKVFALVVGAGSLLWTFAPDFSADFALTIVACFS